MAFNKGDVVQLKSGGPRMTVGEIGEGGVFCIWFHGHEQLQKVFPPEVLEASPKPEPAPLRRPPSNRRI
jgi:uncharacterized protein YodC (DUF2158 family)